VAENAKLKNNLGLCLFKIAHFGGKFRSNFDRYSLADTMGCPGWSCLCDSQQESFPLRSEQRGYMCCPKSSQGCRSAHVFQNGSLPGGAIFLWTATLLRG
jgi:hypothetical protein